MTSHEACAIAKHAASQVQYANTVKNFQLSMEMRRQCIRSIEPLNQQIDMQMSIKPCGV